MANNITNRITSSKVVIDYLMNDDNHVDFNNLLKMPDELSIDGFHLGLEKLLNRDLSIPSKHNFVPEGLSYATLPEKDQCLYNKAVQNYKKFGHLYWYTWTVENWGTKWNAYQTSRISDTVVEFETAWSGVPKILQLLSQKFPEHEILYVYADEDIGSNVGKSIYLNGGCVEYCPIEELSTEAYELAFELMPDSKEYYSNVGGEYIYNDNS